MNIVKRWEETYLLKGIAEDRKESVANCFESQNAFNEENDADASFKRLSIPIIRRAIATSQTMQRNDFVLAEDVPAGLTPAFHAFKVQCRPLSVTNLTEETELVADLSEHIRLEFDHLFEDCIKKKIYFKGLDCNDGWVYLWYNIT